MMFTFESGLKKANNWITIASGDSEPLRKSSIKSLLRAVAECANLEIKTTASWSFDGDGVKNGYKLTFTASNKDDDYFEVFPTTKYPFLEQRTFRTFEALERFCLSLDVADIEVNCG